MKHATFVLCLGTVLVLGLGRAANGDTVTLQLVSGGSVTSHDGSVYVGPYELSVDGQIVYVPCDDYSDRIVVGESWQATVLPFTSVGVSEALFGGYANADTLYLEAAYLTSLFGSAPASEYNDISYALWGLFDPAALASPNYDSGAKGFLSSAQGVSLSFSEFKGWEIYTPINGTQPRGDDRPQEFLVPGSTSTPEPATLALLGSGLLGIGLLRRRRVASSRTQP